MPLNPNKTSSAFLKIANDPHNVHYFGSLTSNYAFEIIHIGCVDHTMKNSSTGVNIRFTCVLDMR